MLMKGRLTINNSVCGRLLLSMLTLLLMSVAMQAEETSTTYTFTGMSAVSGSDYQYEVTSTSGEASETWKIKNFSTTDESYNNRTFNYELETQSLGISHIFATSTSATIIDFHLVSDFTLQGDFVSAEITYSTSGMSQCKAIVYKVGDSFYSTLTDANNPLGTSPATISLKSSYEDEKYFNDKKIALGFTFITNKSDSSDGAFSIQSIKITTTPHVDYYDLWVNGEQVTSENKDAICSGQVSTGVVSFDGDHTLTLNNASINAYNNEAVVSGLDNLTIFLVGESGIYGSNGFTFNKTSEVEEATITFTTDGESNGSLFIQNLEAYLFGEGVTPVYSKVFMKHDGDSHSIDCLLDVRVGRVEVTSFNKDNVLGEGITGTVSYDDVNHILTLNNATINWEEEGESTGIAYSGTANLTIKLIGTNKVGGTGGCEAICYYGEGQQTHPKLIFTKGDNKTCSLMLNADTEFEGTVISGGFSEIQGVWGVGATDNGLAIIADNEVQYDSEEGLKIKEVVNYTANYVPLSSTQIASYYGLTISGVPVYDGNKESITGEGIYGNGTASFDPTTNTLTLNNVNLNPDYAQNDGDLRISIVTSLAQLNINLIGESQTYGIKATSETCKLTFKSEKANRGAARLNFWYDAEPYFVGFGENKVTYNDGLCLREDSYNSSFPMVVALNVPKVVTNEKERGLYYPDHEFTFALEEAVEGFDIYYANMLGGNPVKTTNGKFTLAEGNYVIRAYPIYPGMDTEPGKNWQFASEIYAKVIAKPTFSRKAGTYNEGFTLTLQNVPEQDTREEWVSDEPENILVPQVWYYLDNNKNDSIRYDATTGIPVTESCKVSVYIIDVDSAKKLKSQPVEAQYVIRQTPGYHFSTSSTGQSYTPSGSTISNLDYGSSSNVLPRLINVPSGLSITYNSSDENVATVSSTGVITLTGAGYVWISASNAATDVYAAHEERVRLEIRPSDPIISLEHGIYYTGQEVTLTPTVPNGTMYYSFGYNGEWIEYNEGDVITLPKGDVELYPFTRCGTEQEYMDSYGNGHISYYVYDEPTFNVASGTYNEEQYVTIGNLPTDGQGTVYYYFYDETLQEEDANMVEYHANDVITVTESSILKALIARVDTGKQIKTQPVEAQYVIRQDAGLAYTQNNEPVEVAVYTIGGTDNEDLPELVNENGVAVTYSSDDENVATVNAETGAVTIVGIGETTITATSAQTATLMAGEAAYTLRVYKDLNYESITVTVADATYTGEAVEPTVTVMDGETDITELMNISYANNVEVGDQASVTIVPNDDLEVNFYVGSRTKTFSIVTRTLEIGKDVNFASGQKWASFYTTTEDLELPDGVMAYIVTGISTETVTVKAINYVPKDVPVLIEKESTTTTDNTSAEGNLLQGTSESTAVSGIEGNVYVLYNGGFTRTTSGAIPAKRAYLVLEQAVNARLSIVEGEATDITSVGYDSVATDGSTYDMQGRKVESLSKRGLYIKNGRKVVIK